jgi:cell division protein ZapA
MHTVTVLINSRKYTITCDPSQEQRVHELALVLDEKSKIIANHIKEASETQLLVLTSLMVVDELSEIKNKLKSLQLHYEQRIFDEKTVENQKVNENEAFINSIESMATRMEHLAAEIKSA